MTSLTREEREARIERDDGDPEETVHTVARSSQSMIYHDDPTCQGLFNDATLKAWTREQAQDRTRAPCRYCVLKDASTNTKSTGMDPKMAELLNELHGTTRFTVTDDDGDD